MNLKLRYGLFLLFVLALLILFCTAAVYLLWRGHYVLTAGLLAVLYLTTYILGRKFARIFFVLSILRLLRQNNGSMSYERYEDFINNALGTRKKPDRKNQLKKEVLENLQKEGIVSFDGENIVLLSP